MTPIIGIPACTRELGGHTQHATPARYGVALIGGSGAVPILIPPVGEAMLAVLDRIDGLLLDGSPSNVHPDIYAGGESETPDSHDHERDATTLPLARAAIARGMPLLAICRGIQELNVALGGTLHQRVSLVAGRDDHDGYGTREEQYAPRHDVRLSGRLAAMIGRETIRTNSVHGQAIDRLAPGLVVEGVARDGTIEAVRVENARGFAFGVQWHPEWRWAEDAASRAIFAAFGEACRAYAAGLSRAA
jgi:putative glutamine amidotransferase